MSSTSWVVGIDLGGTWIRLCALSPRRKIVLKITRPAPSLEQLPHFLKKVLAPYRQRLLHLMIGSKGVWKQNKKKWLARALEGTADQVSVISDVEATWEAAFGHSARPMRGVVVIAGTGSIAYGRRADGTFARAGGRGPGKGDEGSGYWIGKEWLARTGKRNKRRGTTDDRRGARRALGSTCDDVRRVAALAPEIVKKARSKHALASLIIREAQEHLVDLFASVSHRLRLKGTVKVALHGSVLQNTWFQKGFLQMARRRGLRLELKPLTFDIAFSLASSFFSRPSSLIPRPASCSEV